MTPLVAPPTANKIETLLSVALAAAANHGLDLLSGCCSLGSLCLRQASIPFSCLSNAIICDLKRRMSSIRRSSLISITLGLLTVIGAVHLRLAFARRYGAGRPVLSLGWRLGPAPFGSYHHPSIPTA